MSGSFRFFPAFVPTTKPSFKTVTRSVTFITSLSRCEMNIMAIPCPTRVRIIFNNHLGRRTLEKEALNLIAFAL